MLQTYEAILQPNGSLQFLDQPAKPASGPCHVDSALCGAALSESVLAQDWLRDEEDVAWANLQAAK